MSQLFQTLKPHPTLDCAMCGPTPTGVKLPPRQSLIPIDPQLNFPQRVEAMCQRYSWNMAFALTLLTSPEVTTLSAFEGGVWKTKAGSDLGIRTGFVLVHLRSAMDAADPTACMFEGHHFPTLCTAGQVFAYKLMGISDGNLGEPNDLSSVKAIPFACISSDDFVLVVRADIVPLEYEMMLSKNRIGKAAKGSQPTRP